MPEGDTVWLHAHRLHQALAGHRLVRGELRVPALAEVDLGGRVVLEVVAAGKHLLTRFDDGWTLHTHLRMDGTWRIFPAGGRWSGGPAWQVRAVLSTAGHDAVGYRLPVVELVRTDEEAAVVGHLGPDLLAEPFDAAEARRRLAAEPDRELGLALLDQRVLAGLGNLYRCEVLFLQGLSPWLTVGEAGGPDLLDRLVARSRTLLRANRERWEQSTTGSLRRGDQHWVFERTGRPCRRCGTRVRQAGQGEAPRVRLTYWCPHCQRGPSPP